MPQRSVFFVSDGTGITAETFGNSILAQFDLQPHRIRLPFVDSVDKAHQAVARINHAASLEGHPPVVFTTLVEREVLEVIRRCSGLVDSRHGRARLVGIVDEGQAHAVGLQVELGQDGVAEGLGRDAGSIGDEKHGAVGHVALHKISTLESPATCLSRIALASDRAGELEPQSPVTHASARSGSCAPMPRDPTISVAHRGRRTNSCSFY